MSASRLIPIHKDLNVMNMILAKLVSLTSATDPFFSLFHLSFARVSFFLLNCNAQKETEGITRKYCKQSISKKKDEKQELARKVTIDFMVCNLTADSPRK